MKRERHIGKYLNDDKSQYLGDEKWEIDSDPTLHSSARVLTEYNEMCLSELSHAAVIGAEVANSFFYKGNIKTRSICH